MGGAFAYSAYLTVTYSVYYSWPSNCVGLLFSPIILTYIIRSFTLFSATLLIALAPGYTLRE